MSTRQKHSTEIPDIWGALAEAWSTKIHRLYRNDQSLDRIQRRHNAIHKIRQQPFFGGITQ